MKDKLLFGIYLTSNLSDFLTTYIGLSKVGMVETNAVGPLNSSLVKLSLIGVTSAFYSVFSKIRDKGVRRLAMLQIRVALLLMTVLFLYCTLNNILMII